MPVWRLTPRRRLERHGRLASWISILASASIMLNRIVKSTRHHVAVLVTAPDAEVARRLAQSALQDRLCACAQIVTGLESHYWWTGKLGRSSEVLVIFKTLRKQVADLEAVIRREHPYETPQFVVMPIAAGSAAYLDWVVAETRVTRRR